jgi:sporulation related protein
MKFLFAAAFCTLGFISNAQDTTSTPSSVTIHKDPRVDLLIKKQSQINEETSKKKTAKGFRVVVVSSNNRDEAISAKSKLFQLFPELKSYLYYQPPYFRVKAGNFKTRAEAEDYQTKLNKYFSNSVYITADMIELKPEVDDSSQ